MKHSHLLGDLPRHKSGVNVGRLDRAKAARQLGITKKALHKAYNNWCQIFRIEGSTLTLRQYFNKLDMADITIFDLGVVTGTYNLSRYRDEGPYTNASCRFILAVANKSEQKKVPIFQRMIARYGIREATKRHRASSSRGGKMTAEIIRANGGHGPMRPETKAMLSVAMKRIWAERRAKNRNGPVVKRSKTRVF